MDLCQAASSSSSSSSSVEDVSVSTSSLITHSLEIPDHTSLRIGGVDGEMDRIYRSLGVSGPDDLAIKSSFNLHNHQVLTIFVKSKGYLVPIDLQGSSSSENDCDEEEAGDEKVGTKETGDMFNQLGDTADEACSFTTNEGDSSSTVSNSLPICAYGGYIITSWQKGQLLGRGSFGSVYKGISEDGDFFAVKEVSLLDQGSQAQECIQQLEGEIALLSQLQHQNIVRYRGTAKQRYRLRNSVVSTYTRQILDGLKYLHDKGFIHRDIKCANILVDANGAVILADFGLAKVSKLNDIKSCKGTPFWMAPEVINPKRNEGYGSPADIWSLGCTVLEMLTGQIPYGSLEPVQALFRIGMGTLPDIPDTLSLDARHFVLECLKVNPEERPTAAELLNHPFVRRPLPSMGLGEQT